jgi:hypothetical protein
VYPQHGQGLLSYVVTCPGGVVQPVVEFTVYIDPSGVVVDQFGGPVVGATVTLLRRDEVLGVYEVVPSGSVVMDSANRVNPVVTTSNGRFHWDVVDGWYKVRAELPGGQWAETAEMQVPPERTDLVIRLADVPGASAPVPLEVPKVSVSPVAGSTVSVSAGRWAADIVVDSVTWLAGGVQIGSGREVKVPDSAVGKQLSAVVGAHRVVYGLPNGVRPVGGDLTGFEFPFDYTVAAGSVTAPKAVDKTDDPGDKPGDKPSDTVPLLQPGVPAVVGSVRVGQMLTAGGTPWPAGTSLTYQWLVAGQPIVGATGPTLVLASAHRGKTIQVQVTGVNGASSWVQVSGPSVKVAAGLFAKKPVPKISGKAKVGAKLKVKAGTWDKGTVKSYRWYVGGKKIKKGTSATLKIKPAWVGKTIRVKVTAKKPGYTTTTKTSKKTAKIKQ